MSENDYKKLLEGLFAGLMLARDGSDEGISSMKGGYGSKSSYGQSIGVNSGMPQGYFSNGANTYPSLPEKGSGSDSGLLSASPNKVIQMVNSSGGTSEPTKQTRWIFIANPNCCPKCLSMNGKIEVGDKEPQFYGHVPDREGRFNCRCHWVRMN